jgi:hypothetical protein
MSWEYDTSDGGNRFKQRIVDVMIKEKIEEGDIWREEN